MGEAKRRKAAQGTPAPGQQAAAQLERGRQHQAQGDPLAALTVYAQVLGREPGNVEALQLSALALVELGQLPLASERLQQALTRRPDDAGLHYQLGRVHLLAGRAQDALACFAQALHCDPAHGPTLFMRGATLETLGDTAGAAEAFIAAARAEPSRTLAHVGAARQLYLLDRLPEAMAHQSAAAALEPRVLDDGRIGHARARPLDEALAMRRVRSVAQCHAPAGVDIAQAVADRELLVIDDFLPDPMAWREHALRQTYSEARHHVAGNFPGRQSAGGHADPATLQRIADLLARDLKWGWPSHGAFRLSPAYAKAHSDIHADLDDDRPAYAGVLYLSLPAHCHGGTSFWRHRETGWEKVPDAAQAAASRFGHYDAFIEQRRDAEGAHFQALADATRGDWDRVLDVPMRFNRLILYRSDYFHAITSLFGHGPTDSRLVQLFFFEPLGPAVIA